MSMRRFSGLGAVVVSLIFSFFPDLQAGGRQRAVAVPLSSSDLSLTFTGSGRAETAMVDAGSMSWRGGRKRYSVTTRTFGVRIGPAAREARGTATLRAFLATPDPHATIRINGTIIGTAPRVIQRHAPIGITLTHRLDIEVPVTAPAGPLAATIGWEVTKE